jgi:hypothetical protein
LPDCLTVSFLQMRHFCELMRSRMAVRTGPAAWQQDLAVFALLVALIPTLAGCAGATHGTATVWVTEDRGAHVVLVRHVPAGLTAMQGLERVAHVQTTYAGRFVQAIDGVSGSLARQRDWFYFVNGYEADRGAAEYRLHDGDVEWWDYRSWKHEMSVPVVVGAFPEPFLHGYGGKRRPAYVVYDQTTHAKARGLAKELGAKLIRYGAQAPHDANVLTLQCTALLPHPRFTATIRFPTEGAGSPVSFTANCVNPPTARFRYSVP